MAHLSGLHLNSNVVSKALLKVMAAWKTEERILQLKSLPTPLGPPVLCGSPFCIALSTHSSILSLSANILYW
jgi:hypothetical protein